MNVENKELAQNLVSRRILESIKKNGCGRCRFFDPIALGCNIYPIIPKNCLLGQIYRKRRVKE